LKAEVGRRRRSPVDVKEVIAVFDAAVKDTTTAGIRDACIIALLCEVGLRDLDVLALQVEDYDCACARLAFGPQGAGRVELSPVAKTALDRWLAIRGLQSGPLINPIRPHLMTTRAVSRPTLNDVLFRRARMGGIDPFTTDDVRRTGVLLTGGPWHVSQLALAQICEPFPVSKGNWAMAGSIEPSPCDPSTQAVIRFASRVASVRRSGILSRLDRLARLMSAGRDTALSFNWCALKPEQIPPSKLATEGLSLREINFMRRALHGVLKQGVSSGAVAQQVYASIVGREWIPKKRGRR